MKLDPLHYRRLPAQLLSALLIILFACAGINAARTLAAEVIAYPVHRRMEIALNDPASLSPGRWQDMRTYLQQALSYDPENPFMLHQLGNAYMQQYQYTSHSNEAAIDARRQAARYYRRAMALRPSWPHDRIDYLLAKYRLGEMDSGFYQQLSLANRLGPWEAWVQHVTAQIGLVAGESLPAGMRETVMASIMNGVKHPDGGRKMLEILRRYNSLDLVCGEVADKRVVEFCNRVN